MTKSVLRLAWILLLLPGLFLIGCDDDDCPECIDDADAPPLAFVGSETCGDCHETIYNTFIESGHPYKLTEVTGGVGPVYPWDDEHTANGVVSRDGPPPGTQWTDFAWVIGGYGWKARFVKPDGNVYTDGAEAQLNIHAPAVDSPEWVPYNQDTVKPYDYSCFRCHTTGASDEGSWPAGSTGFGTFAFGGVQCEACHGEGSQHAFEPETFEMMVDSSAELCGQCHYRDSQNRVAVSGGFIRHHEQYDEFIHSPHAGLSCGSCHDPHAGVVYDDVAMGQGVNAACTDCHPGYDTNINHNGAPTCTDCHMPKAAKSARAFHAYAGDVSSHTFTINTDAVGKDAMWTSDGRFLALDEFGRGRITLDFACYGCHVDGSDVGGGTASFKSLADLSTAAQGMHPVTKEVAR